MPDVTLRPLSFGELIDRAVNLFRRLFVPLVLVQIICTGVLVPLQLYLASSERRLTWAFVFLVLANMVLSALASAAVAIIVSESYLGRQLTAWEALARVLRRFWSVITISIVIALILLVSAAPSLAAIGSSFVILVQGSVASQPSEVAVAVVLFVVGLLLTLIPLTVYAGLALGMIALVVERIGPVTALHRSWGLTKGSRLRLVGLMLVTMVLLLIPLVALAVAAALLHPANHQSAPTLFQAVAQALVLLALLPLVYCVLTLLYYDLRVRKEAFDLQMLAESLAG